MFSCKCCKVLQAENEHLRQWINRLMEQKAPEPEKSKEIDPRLQDEEDILYQTSEA